MVDDWGPQSRPIKTWSCWQRDGNDGSEWQHQERDGLFVYYFASLFFLPFSFSVCLEEKDGARTMSIKPYNPEFTTD